ncbi:MAG: chemotaxis protein CheC, partial [Candidatus Omnitrophota bacterium]
DEMVDDKQSAVTGVYLKTLGDVQGAVVFMFSRESSLKLSDILLSRKPGETKFIDEKSQSALKELGSILTGAFFSVLADMMGLKVFHQAPSFAMDDAHVLMYGICEGAFGDRKQRLCLATEFIESGSKISGSFAFIPGEEAMRKILEKLVTG